MGSALPYHRVMDAGRPNDDDPEFEPSGDPEALDDTERDALRQDLLDVEVLKEVLGPKGIKGAVFYCPDCDEDHFLAWDLLAGNLKELLEAGESPIHEPAFDPDPDEYVSWDYARGFLDGYESYAAEEVGEMSSKLADELTARDWRVDEVKSLLARLGLDSPGSEGDAGGRGS